MTHKVKKTEQIGVRVTPEMDLDLEIISQVEGVDKPELIRGWIRDRIGGYQRDKRYLAKREAIQER